MYFRCSTCLSATWLDRIEPVRASETLVCGECESCFPVKPIQKLGATLGDHYQRASKLITEHRIDMPTAYSVLLGVMTLDEVSFLRGTQETGPGSVSANEAKRSDAAKPAETGAPLLLEIDPEFAVAIAAGCLTEQEAFRRGDRQAYAVRLARKHGISIDLAYRVTDNRISLSEARKRRPEPRPVARRGKATTYLQGMVVLGLASVITLSAGWRIWIREFVPVRQAPTEDVAHRPPPNRAYQPSGAEPDPVPTDDRQAPGIEILADLEGRPTRIVGPDPTSVLKKFCESSSPFTRREPLRIVETVPRSPDARLGVFRDLDSLATESTVRIRRDWRTRRWVAGDGTHAIAVMDAAGRTGEVLRAAVEDPARE